MWAALLHNTWFSGGKGDGQPQLQKCLACGWFPLVPVFNIQDTASTIKYSLPRKCENVNHALMTTHHFQTLDLAANLCLCIAHDIDQVPAEFSA